MLTLDLGHPAAPPVSDSRDGPVEEWRDAAGRLAARCYRQGGRFWIQLPGVGAYSVARGSPVVTVAAEPAAPRALLEDGFRRTVGPLALQALGFEALHASAVLGPGGVVAFGAYSGTGKSTIAFGLDRRGYPVWADDAVVLEVRPGLVQALPLPFRVRLRPASAAYFGFEPSGSTDPEWRGGEAIRQAVRPEPVAAVVVVSRSDDDRAPVALRRLSPAAAFGALMQHAHAFSLADPARTRLMASHYLQVAASVPVLDLAFRADLARIPAILDELERGLADPSAVETR
jgi:hypothetical protein